MTYLGKRGHRVGAGVERTWSGGPCGCPGGGPVGVGDATGKEAIYLTENEVIGLSFIGNAVLMKCILLSC